MYLEDDIPVGFVYQQKEGSCGVYALANIMTLLGKPTYIEDAQLYTNFRSRSDSFKKHFSLHNTVYNFNRTFTKIMSDYGVREKGIIGAVKKAGLKSNHFTTLSEREAQEFLNRNLKNYNPLLLRVNYPRNPAGHWFVCAGINKSKYIIIDSDPIAYKKGLISSFSWIDLYRRCTWYNQSGKFFQFNAIAVEQTGGINLLPKLTDYLGTLQKNLELQYWWGYYLDDLISVFNIGEKILNPISSEDFFKEYSVVLTETISYWYDSEEIPLGNLKRELNNYKRVAMAYNMSFEKEMLPIVLVSMTSTLIANLLYDQ